MLLTCNKTACSGIREPNAVAFSSNTSFAHVNGIGIRSGLMSNRIRSTSRESRFDPDSCEGSPQLSYVRHSVNALRFHFCEGVNIFYLIRIMRPSMSPPTLPGTGWGISLVWNGRLAPAPGATYNVSYTLRYMFACA